MSRDDGFTVADVDSSYFDDAKMRDLWHALGDADRMARAVCLHQSTLLASWRAGSRVTVAQAVPLWLAVDAELVTVLRAVKLLDRFGKIPSDSWQVWFGTAYKRREVRRVSGRAGGLVAAQRRGLPGEHPRKRAQHRHSVAAATPEHPSSPAVPVRPSVRTTSNEVEKTPPPPTRGGRRRDRTNPRAVGASPRQEGENPRTNGTSVRQEREAQKTGPTSLREIIARIQAGEAPGGGGDLGVVREELHHQGEPRELPTANVSTPSLAPPVEPLSPDADAPADAAAESWFEPGGAT